MTRNARSHGAFLLARLGKTQAEIAARIGVTRTAVENWLAGIRLPAHRFRMAMQRAYKISAESWEEPVPPRPPRPAKAFAQLVVQSAEALEDIAKHPAEAGVRARALRLAGDIDQLRKDAFDDKESTPLERAKVLASCATTLKLVGTLTGETLEISEARVLRLAAWRRIQDLISRVLTPWPEAMRLLGDELRRLGAEQ